MKITDSCWCPACGLCKTDEDGCCAACGIDCIHPDVLNVIVAPLLRENHALRRVVEFMLAEWFLALPHADWRDPRVKAYNDAVSMARRLTAPKRRGGK